MALLEEDRHLDCHVVTLAYPVLSAYGALERQQVPPTFGNSGVLNVNSPMRASTGITPQLQLATADASRKSSHSCSGKGTK